jgi:hypothetical protein
MDLYDDSTSDRFSAVRRILSVSPGEDLPERGAINTEGAFWLVGEDHPDFFRGRIIRRKFILHRADGLARLRSFAEWLHDDPGYKAYLAKAYIRSAKEVEISSELYNIYEIFFARGEASHVPTVSLVTLEGQDFIAHDPYFTEGGFLAVRGTFLPRPRVTARFDKRTYDPVSDAWTGEPLEVPVLRMRWQEHFQYLTRYSEPYESGDVQFTVLQDDVPLLDARDTLEVEGVHYVIVTVRPEEDGAVWSIHGRPS